MLQQMQREVNEARPFEDRLCNDYFHNNHSLHVSSENYLDCCFMESCHGENHHTVDQFSEGVEILLKETAKRNRSNFEAVDGPESAPQDYPMISISVRFISMLVFLRV